MLQHLHVHRRRQLVAVALREIRGTTEALESLIREIVTWESADHRTQRLRQRRSCQIREFARLADPVGGRIIRHQIVKSDRPAAMRNEISLLEIDTVERHASTAPDHRGTAELAPAKLDRRT